MTNKKCPKCRESPESIIHTTFKYHGRGSNRRLRREDNAISLKNEEEDDYLTLHLHDELPMIMCLNPDHHHAEYIERDEEVKKMLILLFKKLKRVVNPLHHNQLEDEDKKQKSYDLETIIGDNYDKKLDSITSGDTSILFECLKGLAIGENKTIEKQREKAVNSQLFLASKNLRRALNPRGSLLRRLLSNALTVLGSDKLNILLCRMGLCYSRQMERRNNASRVEATKAGIFDSIKLSKFAYAILLFDNLGFKNRQGWRKGLGYEQFTILKVVIIDEKELRKSGLYNSNSELELNRKWHNWEEIRSQPESSFESIVKPNDNDTELFAGVVLDIIKGIIKSEVDGVFPSLAECKNLLKTKAYKNGGKPRVWKGDAYYGYNVDSHQNDDELDSEKVIYDVPMHEDLNKNSTVLEILEYVREINEFIINNGEETEGFEHFRPILHDARISMAGDGSPIISAQNIMKKNDNLRNKVTAVFGGFHLMLELYKK